MTQPLISVRNLAETRLLPLEQVGILDIKEPLRGPLGRADVDTIAEIQHEVGNSVPVSVALGELVDCDPTQLEELPPVAFAKFGLSKLGALPDWKALWAQCISRLPLGTQPVAVIYADWQSCGAPSPEEIVAAAQDISCRAILVDTFEKMRGICFIG